MDYLTGVFRIIATNSMYPNSCILDMTSDGKFSDFNEGVPQAFICKQEEGRFRDVSVNDSSNRVFFVDDVTSVMYVCDLTHRALLFKVRTHIRYPLCVYARGEVVTVYNYTSKRLTFYTRKESSSVYIRLTQLLIASLLTPVGVC